MEYSEYLLRGIPTDDWVQDGIITAAAFQFNDSHMKNGWMAQSVCWEDDDSVCSCMFQQKKPGNDYFQFNAGIARLHRESIHYINRLNMLRDIISYDREPLEDNPYHGNLLLSVQSNRTQRRMISVQLASHIKEYIPRPEEMN